MGREGGKGKGRIGIGKISIFCFTGDMTWSRAARRVNPRSSLGFHMPIVANPTHDVPCKSRSLAAPRRALFRSERDASLADAITYSV